MPTWASGSRLCNETESLSWRVSQTRKAWFCNRSLMVTDLLPPNRTRLPGAGHSSHCRASCWQCTPTAPCAHPSADSSPSSSWGKLLRWPFLGLKSLGLVWSVLHRHPPPHMAQGTLQHFPALRIAGNSRAQHATLPFSQGLALCLLAAW